MKILFSSIVAIALVFGCIEAVDARDEGSSKLSRKIGKKQTNPYAEQYMDDYADQDHDVDGVIRQQVDETVEEVRILIENAVANAVEAAILDNMDDEEIGEIVVVDSEGNELEILSVDEDGTITVDIFSDDSDDDGPIYRWDGSSSK